MFQVTMSGLPQCKNVSLGCFSKAILWMGKAQININMYTIYYATVSQVYCLSLLSNFALKRTSSAMHYELFVETLHSVPKHWLCAGLANFLAQAFTMEEGSVITIANVICGALRCKM